MDDQLAFSSPNCNNFYSGRKKISLKYGIKLHGLWICRCRSTGSRPQFRVMVSIYSWPASKSVYCMPPNLYDEKNVGLSCRPLHGTHCPHDLMMCCSSCSPLFFFSFGKNFVVLDLLPWCEVRVFHKVNPPKFTTLNTLLSPLDSTADGLIGTYLRRHQLHLGFLVG